MTKDKQPFAQSNDPTGLANDDRREGDAAMDVPGLDDAVTDFAQNSELQGGDTRVE